jgi:hypothetical protein
MAGLERQFNKVHNHRVHVLCTWLGLDHGSPDRVLVHDLGSLLDRLSYKSVENS